MLWRAECVITKFTINSPYGQLSQLSGQIKLYWLRDVLCDSLRRCQSSSNIFGTAVLIALYWSIVPELTRKSFFVRKIETAGSKISDEDIAAQ